MDGKGKMLAESWKRHLFFLWKTEKRPTITPNLLKLQDNGLLPTTFLFGILYLFSRCLQLGPIYHMTSSPIDKKWNDIQKIYSEKSILGSIGQVLKGLCIINGCNGSITVRNCTK